MLAAIIALVLATPAPVLNVQTLFPVEKTWTINEMQELATEKAKEHGLKVQKFLDVISCESGWDRVAVGDNGTSFGLAQFHYPLRDWGITREQANDPEIALELMASVWERGEAYRWSCWYPS